MYAYIADPTVENIIFLSTAENCPSKQKKEFLRSPGRCQHLGGHSFATLWQWLLSLPSTLLTAILLIWVTKPSLGFCLPNLLLVRRVITEQHSQVKIQKQKEISGFTSRLKQVLTVPEDPEEQRMQAGGKMAGSQRQKACGMLEGVPNLKPLRGSFSTPQFSELSRPKVLSLP